MRKADNLPPSCAVVTKSRNLNFLEPSGPVQACNGTALPFTMFLFVKQRSQVQNPFLNLLSGQRIIVQVSSSLFGISNYIQAMFRCVHLSVATAN